MRRAVNWRQAAGEALLIFFGVGVALLGQAAWEARVERNVVRQHVAGLLDELRANRRKRAATAGSLGQPALLDP